MEVLLWVKYMHRGYRNIAFFASQEDSASGDENTFYLWPSHITPRILTVLNHVLSDEDVDWEALPISYPVTMEDLVEHWEVVWDLCISLDITSPTNRIIYPQSYEALTYEMENE